MSSFMQKLHSRIVQKNTRLCVGIDPDVSFFKARNIDINASFLESFVTALVEASGENAAAVKFQIAFFEALGSMGWQALEQGIKLAKTKNLPVIVDAKRGDIANTMRAYGVSLFDRLGADCITICPYMGLDVIEPLLHWLAGGRGVYVLAMTSNPSAKAIQKNISGEIVKNFSHWADEKSVNESLGFVLGAEHAVAYKDNGVDSNKNYLIPGVGAQGTAPEQMSCFLRDSKCSVVNVSRGLYQVEHGVSDASALERVLHASIQGFSRSLAHNQS